MSKGWTTAQGSLTPNPPRMKGTFTPIYRVKVPFMRTGGGQLDGVVSAEVRCGTVSAGMTPMRPA